MARMTERELAALIDHEFRDAMGAQGGEVAQERAEAWKYYLSKPIGNEIEGQSQIVTSDVSDVVDGMMPSLLRIFTVQENLVDFDPTGPEDVEQAQQESDYVNHVFFKQNNAFTIFYQWFFDALVQKNGIVKAWWDDSEIVTRESYEGLNEQELAELLDDDELEIVEQEERTETMEQEVQTPLGIVMDEVEQTFHDVTFKRTSTDGKVAIEPVPPEEYRISADAHSIDPESARMIGQEREMTRSELIEMGFDRSVVEDLPAEKIAEQEEELQRRDKTDDEEIMTSDSSQDRIVVKEVYLKVDYDDDGISELRQVIEAGGKILLNEQVDRQPFHVISPQPLPHKHFGRAAAEKVMDIQKINTTLMRQMLDNLYHTNNPQHGVWEQAIGEHTLEDLMSAQAGSIKRFERPINEAYQSITVPFTAGNTFPMLEWWDKAKRERSGVAQEGEGLDPEALKNIQTTVLSQANDLSKMKIEAVARIFAETGIKSLFRHIHELLLKHQDKETIAQIRGRFVPVNPQQWRTRTDMAVRVGLGIGTREQNLLQLNAVWEKQREIVENGGAGTLVSAQNIFNTASEIVKNANLHTPERFFTDPSTVQQEPEGPSMQEQLAQAQLQLQKREQDIDAREAEITREKNMLQHQRELRELEMKQEQHRDEINVKLEEIANQLTKLDLEHPGTDVPGSVTQGDGQ